MTALGKKRSFLTVAKTDNMVGRMATSDNSQLSFIAVGRSRIGIRPRSAGLVVPRQFLDRFLLQGE